MSFFSILNVFCVMQFCDFLLKIETCGFNLLIFSLNSPHWKSLLSFGHILPSSFVSPSTSVWRWCSRDSLPSCNPDFCEKIKVILYYNNSIGNKHPSIKATNSSKFFKSWFNWPNSSCHLQSSPPACLFLYYFFFAGIGVDSSSSRTIASPRGMYILSKKLSANAISASL